MNILDIYNKYELPPNLIDHQLTVAAVGFNICAQTSKGNQSEIVTACLLHDMGNIIKFKLDNQIKGLELDNVEYWKIVQKRFINTYGPDEHLATMAIVAEIGVSSKIIEIIDSIGFRNSVIALESGEENKMIATYSDMRVAPLGVTSLQQRLNELTDRYGSTDDREKYNNAFREIETLIFSDTQSTPENIDQTIVDKTKEQLKNFDI